MDIAADNPAQPIAQPSAAETGKDSGVASPGPFPRRNVLRAAVDLASPVQVVEHLAECARLRRGCAVAGISAPYATAMRDDPALREAFLQCDILVPDGKGFVWACRLLGVPCGERLAIPDLCERLLARGNDLGWRVFVYGGTDEVNAEACKNLALRFPGLAEVAGQQGYRQGPAEEEALIERLGREQFNLLIVARPSPDKELFLARCCKRAGVVGVAAGGYADILAGQTRRAPVWVQALGLEWLFRIAQEPRRLWKRVGWANLRFAAAVLWLHLWLPSRRPWWGCRAIHLGVLVLALTSAYSTCLHAPYHFDDPEYIENNPAIRSFAGLSTIKVTDFRKLWWLSNAVCYKLSERFGVHQVDKPDVRIFRAWNLACHLIAVLALYGLLRRALRASGHIPETDGAGTAWDLAALGAAAIFAAHPLCTESVTYISGRDNGQGGMFYLLGLYAAAVAFERMGLGGGSRQEAVDRKQSADGSRRETTGDADMVPLAQPAGSLAGLASANAEENPSGQPEAPSASGTGKHPRNSPQARARGTISPTDRPLAWPRWFWPLLWAVFFGACAVGTKESHLTFPVAAGLVYLFFYRGKQARTLSLGALLGIVAALAVLAAGAAGRREGYLGIAFEVALVLIAAGALLGAGGIGGVDPEKRRGVRAFMRRRVHVNWALCATVVGLGLAALLAFPYAYQRTIGALTGYLDSNHVRSLCSQAYAVPRMLGRTIAPLELNIDHDFPSLSDPHDPRVLYGGAIVLALLMFGLIGMWKRWLGAFGVLLALVAIAPSNSVIERGDIASERNFYLAAAGGAIVLAWLVALAAGAACRLLYRTPRDAAGDSQSPQIPVGTESPNHRGAPPQNLPAHEAGLWTGTATACVAIVFCSLTVMRNDDWRDGYSMWRSAHELSRHKIRVLYNYGVACFARKQYDDADLAFSNAIKIGEDKAEKKLFRPDETVQVKCFHLAYAYYAALHLKRYANDPDAPEARKAVHRVDEIFARGLERTVYDPHLVYAYTQFLVQVGRPGAAAKALQQSLDLHPWSQELFYPLGMTYLETSQYEQALHYLSQAVNVQEEHTTGASWAQPAAKRAEIRAFMALCKFQLKQKAAARQELVESLRLDSQGLLVLLTNTSRTRNLTLKPPASQDPMELVLGQTRRDVLHLAVLALNEYLSDPRSADAPEENPETARRREAGVVLARSVRGVLDKEIRRRVEIQRKRLEAGFTDDPDEE